MIQERGSSEGWDSPESVREELNVGRLTPRAYDAAGEDEDNEEGNKGQRRFSRAREWARVCCTGGDI